MNPQENSQREENVTKQAAGVLKALSHFEYPSDTCQVQNWLEATKSLQTLITTLCRNDKTGKMLLECVNALYDVVATRGSMVSPAVWTVLQMVEEKEVETVVETFLKDTTPRLKNALSAFVSGVCQCGLRTPEILTWCYALINGLESKQKYSVILSMSQDVVFKLLHCLKLPHTRQLIYPLIERILYPMIYPQVLGMIFDQIPEILNVLVEDQSGGMKEICDSFCGLVKTLMERFPSTPSTEDVYQKIKAILDVRPETPYNPSYEIWTPKSKIPTEIANILECPVCYERFITPIMVCENGHCICSNCKNQLKSCPLCRAPFSNIRMTIMDQIMEMTEFHCKNFDSGCDVKMLYKDIWNHEVDCEYRTVACDIVICQSQPVLVCNEDVIVACFHDHIEKCHKCLVSRFELGVERTGELKREKMNVVRLLKNSSDTLFFIERIYVTDEEIFFSYHYVGKSSEAKNYVYTVKIRGENVPQKIRYSNFCLPNYMVVYDTELDERCLILEPQKIFAFQQTKFEYSVKIEDVNSYRLRLSKNKFMVSI